MKKIILSAAAFMFASSAFCQITIKYKCDPTVKGKIGIGLQATFPDGSTQTQTVSAMTGSITFTPAPAKMPVAVKGKTPPPPAPPMKTCTLSFLNAPGPIPCPPLKVSDGQLVMFSQIGGPAGKAVFCVK